MFSRIQPSNQQPIIIRNEPDSTTTAIRFVSKFSSTVDKIFIDSNHISISAQERLKKVNTEAHLNLNPNLFNWIIFHSALIAFSSVFLAFFLLDRMFKTSALLATWITKASWLKKLLDRIPKISWLKKFITWFFKKCINYLIVASSLLGFFWYLNYLPDINIWDGMKLLDIFIVSFKSSVVKIVLGVNFIISVVMLMRIFWLLFGLKNERINENLQNENKTEKKESIYEVIGHNQEYYHVSKVSNSIDNQKAKEIVNEINYYSLALSLLVSASIFGSAIQREMICDLVKGLDHLYPYSFIFSYGLVFSFILALVLIPSYIYIFSGEEVKDKKSNLEANIDFLKIIFAVLLPLITSFFKSFF